MDKLYYRFNKLILCGDVEENPGPYSIFVVPSLTTIDFGTLTGKAGQKLTVNSGETGVEFQSSAPSLAPVFTKSQTTDDTSEFFEHMIMSGGIRYNVNLFSSVTNVACSDKSVGIVPTVSGTKKFWSIRLYAGAPQWYCMGWCNVRNMENTQIANNWVSPFNCTGTSYFLITRIDNATNIYYDDESNNQTYTWTGGSGNFDMVNECYLSMGYDTTNTHVYLWQHDTSGTLIAHKYITPSTTLSTQAILAPHFYVHGTATTCKEFKFCESGDHPTISGWTYIYE